MTASPFSRALLSHALERLLSGVAQLQGAALRALAEAQPTIFDGGESSPLALDLLEFNGVLNQWHQRLKRRRETLAADLRLQRGSRR